MTVDETSKIDVCGTLGPGSACALSTSTSHVLPFLTPPFPMRRLPATAAVRSYCDRGGSCYSCSSGCVPSESYDRSCRRCQSPPPPVPPIIVTRRPTYALTRRPTLPPTRRPTLPPTAPPTHQCTQHWRCGQGYCTSRNQCSSCVQCNLGSGSDAINGMCPYWCETRRPTPSPTPECASHSDCDRSAEFCSTEGICYRCETSGGLSLCSQPMGGECPASCFRDAEPECVRHSDCQRYTGHQRCESRTDWRREPHSQAACEAWWLPRLLVLHRRTAHVPSMPCHSLLQDSVATIMPLHCSDLALLPMYIIFFGTH